VSVVAGAHKLILNAGTGEQALYDLAADPGETRDVADLHPDIIRGMRAYLGKLARSQGAQVLFNADEVVVSEARRDLLRSLGYSNGGPGPGAANRTEVPGRARVRTSPPLIPEPVCRSFRVSHFLC